MHTMMSAEIYGRPWTSSGATTPSSGASSRILVKTFEMLVKKNSIKISSTPALATARYGRRNTWSRSSATAPSTSRRSKKRRSTSSAAGQGLTKIVLRQSNGLGSALKWPRTLYAAQRHRVQSGCQRRLLVGSLPLPSLHKRDHPSLPSAGP